MVYPYVLPKASIDIEEIFLGSLQLRDAKARKITNSSILKTMIYQSCRTVLHTVMLRRRDGDNQLEINMWSSSHASLIKYI